MKVFECDQGSPEWFKIRAGMPTASEFSTIMAQGRGGGESKGRRTYLHKLAGELITGEPTEPYTNAHLERGKIMEAEARNFYSFMTDTESKRIGFIANGPKGCSPDALLGDAGMVEIKTALPHILIDYILKDEFPAEHKAQCQGGLWVAEREWIDIIVYWPKMPPLIKRATRDEAYIVTLASAVDQFNAELASVVDKIKRYGTQRLAA